MRSRRAVIGVAVLGLLFAMAPVRPAAALVGTADVEFSVSGTLPTFPCTAPTGCDAGFLGSGTGAGHINKLIGNDVYDATFTIIGGHVYGRATYTEPGAPFCPLIGSASNPTFGQVVLTGGATGVVYRTSSPTLLGTVTGVTFVLDYTYVRVGLTPVITVVGGYVDVSYFFPTTGAGWFRNAIVTGGGTGLFNVDPVQAESRCVSPGPLGFTVTGDVGFALS